MSDIDRNLLQEFFKSEVGKKYVDEAVAGSDFIVVNLDEMDKSLAKTIIDEAVKSGIREVEKALQAVIQGREVKENPHYDIGFQGKIIPVVKIHNVASEDIGKLVRVKGLVSRTHFIKPMAKNVAFICQNCAATDYAEALEDKVMVFQKIPFVLTSPAAGKCEKCDDRLTWIAVDDYSTFIDSQEFSLQEGHEDSHGRPPQILSMIVTKKHLINKVYCGNTIEAVGVVRLIPTYRFKAKSRFFIPYVEVYDIVKDSKDPEDVQISPEEEAMINNLAQEEGIYEKIVHNVAPSIFGMEKFKEGALLSIIGGVDKDKGDIKIRGNIHVLGVGDAGMGKSQILLSATELSPKGISSVGRGVSGAGLTAALTKDELTGDWVVEAGTLVLADSGLATIDEIDKMTENDRMHIHEAMEQQTVTIHKGGRHVILRARTAVLAAANPHLGRYDPNKSVFEQLKNFPRTLFSRFDLIFVFADTADPEHDRRVTNKMSTSEIVEASINRDLLKKYVAYAKTMKPVISAPAEKVLSDYFLSVRSKMHFDAQKESEEGITETPIPITYRQFEGLRRIAEAHAKVLLKTEVDVEDAEAAKRIFGEYLKDINFDLDATVSEIPKTQVDIINTIHMLLKNSMLTYPKGVPVSIIKEELVRRKANTDKVDKLLQDECNAGHIMESFGLGEKAYRLIR